MVSLDAQKQQLELDQKETAREQNLRKNLAILASGFSISGVAASSRSRPTQKILESTKNWFSGTTPQPPIQLPSAVLWLTDIAVFASLGVGAALLVFLSWSGCGQLSRKLRSKQRRWLASPSRGTPG
jgi:hypothetical protein